jgi:hypothetical protein
MTRDEYRKLLLEKGFVFEKTQTAYPSSRGEEDKYIHPEYKYKFYVSRVSLDDALLYGFFAGKINAKYFDDVYLHNIDCDDWAGQAAWTDEVFVELMKRL